MKLLRTYHSTLLDWATNSMKILVPVFMFIALTGTAQATLVRVSDGATVTDLAAETTTVWEIGEGPSDGLLLGAYNVTVNGTLWDVIFNFTSFADMFVDRYGALFGPPSVIADHAKALHNSVFIDKFNYLFDSRPNLTFGCQDPITCVITIAYDQAPSGDVSTASLANFPRTNQNDTFFSLSTGTLGQTGHSQSDGNGFIDINSAWRQSAITTVDVPEPAIWILVLFGIGAVLTIRSISAK